MVLIMVGISLALVLLVAGVTLSANGKTLREQTEAAVLNANQSLATGVDTHLQQAVTTTRIFAGAVTTLPDETPLTQVWPLASSILVQPENIVTRIYVYAPFRDGFQILIFNPPNAPSRVASVTTLINPTVAEDAWFLDVLAGGAARWHGPDTPYDRSATQDAASYAVPLRSAGGQTMGVVWVDITQSMLNGLMGQMMLMDDRRSYSLLLTGDNSLAGSYKLPGVEDAHERAGAFLSLPQFAQIPAGANRIFTAPDPFTANRDAAVLVSSLPESGWRLISLLPASVLATPLERDILQILVVSLIGAAVLGAVVHGFTGRAISDPLRTLGTAAQEIGSGDLRYQIEHQDQRDEIGRLAKALEGMKVNLAHSYRQLSLWSQTLEKRVEQRTAELEIARSEAQANAAELQAVYDSAMSVVSDYELDILLRKLMDNMLELLKVSYCAIWLLISDKKHLQLVASTADRSRLGMVISSEEGLVGAATRDQKLIVIDDYTIWPGRLARMSDPNVQRAMSAPLMFYRRPIGAVVVGRTFDAPPFDEREQRLLMLFANLVSPVVRNAQLFIQREEALKEAERANGVKTRFLASVTHELRTPLNLIINNMDFMRIGAFGDTNEEQRARLDQGIRSAEHLLYLINDLLDVSKIEAGEMELTILPSDLSPVLEDALDSALMLMERMDKHLTIKSHVPENLPLIPMDARRVRQVLTNLLSNAVKFTQEGRIDLTVRIKPAPQITPNATPAPGWRLSELNGFQERPGTIEFEVKDTGMGIPQEEMDKLFMAFERTDRAKYMGIEGTGLGLPISRYLVEAHGGKMIVISSVGRGSTFTFNLPLQPDEQQDKPPNPLTSAIGLD